MKNNFLIKKNNNKESIFKNSDSIKKENKKTKKLLFNLSKANKKIDNNNIKLSNNDEEEVKIKLKKRKYKILNNLIYSRNINDYQQFLTDYRNTHNGNLSWATHLRESQKKSYDTPKKDKLLKNKINISSKLKVKGITLTNNFKEPNFYSEDLEKYKSKLKKQKRPLSSILNPNFNNIKHWFINKNGGEHSKEFASCISWYNFSEKKPEKKLKWNRYFNDYKEYNKNLIKFLLPRTQEGKKNLKKLENKIFKTYNVLYKDIVLGNDAIKQKVMTPKKDYTYGGIGEHFNMRKYNSHYYGVNTGQFENILKKGTYSQCLFELGLRNYKSFTKNN